MTDLSDLQARMIAEAAEVFGGLAAQLDGADGAPPEWPPATGDVIAEQRLRTASARILDLFAGLLQDGVDAYLEVARSLARPAGPAPLSLRGSPGTVATTTVWIHGSAPGEVSLRMTDLHTAAGEPIDASRARLHPARLRVEPGATASAILTVAIPLEAAAATYFGHVLASGPAAAGLAVTVHVEGS